MAMKRSMVCLAFSAFALAHGQVISPGHTTIKPAPGVTLSVVAISDQAHRISWDLAGRRLTRYAFPNTHMDPSEVKPGFVNRYVIVQTSEQGNDFSNLATLKAMTVERKPIFPIGSDANFGQKSIDRLFGFEMTVPASQKKTDLVLRFSKAANKVYGQVSFAKGKLTHKGFNFNPKLLSTNGGEMYFITLPQNPLIDFTTVSADASGKKTSVSWMADAKHPINRGTPFGTGPSKSMTLLGRPLTKIKVPNIPLSPR